MKNHHRALFLACASLLCNAPDSVADDEQAANSPLPVIFGLTFENDVFADTDEGYTNGVRFSMVWPEDVLPLGGQSVLDAVPFFPAAGTKRFGLALGQSMFTPTDITDTQFRPDDRPYAGWLYGTFSVSSSVNDESNLYGRFDSLQLSLGIIGPSAKAEQTQKVIHNWIDSDKPRGWQYQLNDEPALLLAYRRTWRQAIPATEIAGFRVDVAPHVGATLGNVFTFAATGAMLRFGYQLPDDYGPPRISPNAVGSDFFQPQGNFGWYGFIAAEGRAMARNIFLDGNTFKDSHSVRKRPLVGDIQMGLVATIGQYRIGYTHVFRTEEYYKQDGVSQFGGVTVNVAF